MTEGSLSSNEQLKALAVETHSRQADEFARSYTTNDPYVDCFNYSRHRLDALLERYVPRVTNQSALLDVGCGTGHHMRRYSSLGYRVAGIDGSNEMLSYARANNPDADIRQADVDAVPFPDGSFDVVTAIEVLRYVPEPARFIAEMYRVLAPGGYGLVTASPLLSLNLYPIVNRLAAALPLRSFVRLKQFFHSSWDLRGRFRNAGFARVEVHGVYFGAVNWVERLAPSVTPRVLRHWEPVDRVVADVPGLREFSNMFLVRAVKR